VGEFEVVEARRCGCRLCAADGADGADGVAVVGAEQGGRRFWQVEQFRGRVSGFAAVCCCPWRMQVGSLGRPAAVRASAKPLNRSLV
ncbi:hypothetical protein ACFRR7_36990, partial [Streptomyces sp. NPDC056909]|uniref:hypothetical protein n=1 Tax=Streptomyces sp. NPDC056909 TaxID=3345963 RepID=UPI0036C8486B